MLKAKTGLISVSTWSRQLVDLTERYKVQSRAIEFVILPYFEFEILFQTKHKGT